jgi:hypothetical protein
LVLIGLLRNAGGAGVFLQGKLNNEEAMTLPLLASIALLTATAAPAVAGNTSSNTSSNTSCNSSNGRTTCLHTHDWSVTTDRYRAREYRGSTRVQRHVRGDDRYWRDRRWQFGGDDD